MRSVDKDAARRHWDQIAAAYTAHKEANRDYFDALKALFAAALPEAANLCILELGCGSGDVLRSLGPRCGLGLDFSEAMIEIARRRHAACANLEFQVGDAENLPEGPLYDAVVLPDLLEHVPDWRRAVSEAAEHVKPSGLLVLTTPNPLWAPALYVLEKLHLKMPEGPHRFIALTAIVEHLQHLGFVIVEEGNHLLVPRSLGAVTEWLNSNFRRVPGMAGFGLIQLAVASRVTRGVREEPKR